MLLSGIPERVIKAQCAYPCWVVQNQYDGTELLGDNKLTVKIVTNFFYWNFRQISDKVKDTCRFNFKGKN